jgi:hypothetical protein
MSRLGRIFWAMAAIDAALLVFLLVTSLQDSAGAHDGGREMGLFFFVMLPGLALLFAVLLFRFSSSLPARSIALLIVVLPAAFLVDQQIEDRIIDRRIAADRAGVGYFDTEPMREMGAAVVQRDVATLMRVGPTVDVNAPGRDMTLMRLAVRADDARTSDGSELPVVRALLALGARPDDAMPDGCVRSDPALLQTLIDAGGHPNLLVTPDKPLIFDTMSSITPQNFRLLAEHGLDLDSQSRGDPLPVQLAIYRRWDLLAIAIELGADTKRARADGRTVAGELASQIDEETKAGRAIPEPLRQASAMLDASLNSR